MSGEAPGRDEKKACRPFVGAAGKNLNYMLGLSDYLAERFFITNVIKYRPFTADGGIEPLIVRNKKCPPVSARRT